MLVWSNVRVAPSDWLKVPWAEQKRILQSYHRIVKRVPLVHQGLMSMDCFFLLSGNLLTSWTIYVACYSATSKSMWYHLQSVLPEEGVTLNDEFLDVFRCHPVHVRHRSIAGYDLRLERPLPTLIDLASSNFRSIEFMLVECSFQYACYINLFDWLPLPEPPVWDSGGGNRTPATTALQEYRSTRTLTA